MNTVAWKIERLPNRTYRVTCLFAGILVQRATFATLPAAKAYRDAFLIEFAA